MKRHSKLKGTVLFTVISVMSLLIIFLTSTLVLATSASNRSHKNYAATQTEYTARAAIESFSEAMSRNDAIAQMIVNMKKTDVLTPSVEINDSALGQIGYYDSSGTWVPGQISIEYIDDTYVYNTKENAWEEQQVLKVTATAELAGEESTVSAYIRKKSPDEPTQLSIKGLQTAGGVNATTTGGYYTGALAMGITDNSVSEYSVGSATIFDTDLTFINNNFVTNANLTIDVSERSTGTVIMGNFKMNNPLTINIDYEMSDGFVQKEIPYLYIDGTVSSDSNSITINGNDSPYNVFVGSWSTIKNTTNLNHADLYLMDSGVDNLICYSTTALTAWNNSLHEKSKTQFYSEGGNIYSKGNLVLNHITVNGDVRCEGDVTIDTSDGGEVNIEKNVVLPSDKKLTLKGQGKVTIGGYVYCDNIDTSQMQNLNQKVTIKGAKYGNSSLGDDYVELDNIYHPEEVKLKGGCSKIENPSRFYEYNTDEREHGDGEFIGFFGEKIGWNKEPIYYELDSSGYPIPGYYYRKWQYEQEINKYKEVANSSGNLTGNYVSEQYSYFDIFGNKVSKEDACDIIPEYMTIVNFDGTDSNVPTNEPTSYYNKNTGVRVTLGEAYGGSQILSSSAFNLMANGEGIYPKNMTREAITGKDSAGNPSPDSKQEYKIITSLEEVKEAIGCTGTTFDPSIYYGGEMPDIVKDLYNADGSIKIGADSTGIKNESSNIIGSCVLTSADILGKTIIIQPNGLIWISLDNIIANGSEEAFNIIVDDSSGDVNFFINGTLQLDNSTILTKKVSDGDKIINEGDKIGITFYGKSDSKIIFKNNCTIMGTARCPYTEVTCSSTGGQVGGITYNGSSAPYTPHWIGNALFANTSGGNNFTLLYVGSGSSGEGIITNQLLGESWEIMYYDMY